MDGSGGSFLQNPTQRSGGRDTTAEAAVDEMVGHGFAADRSVRASVGTDGRVVEIVLDPGITQQVEARWLASTIRDAVNRAFDDIDRQVKDSGGALGALTQDLEQVTAGFERAMDTVRSDIARVQQRLERD